MVASPKQIALSGLEDPAAEEAEIEAGYLWREALWSAMRTLARELGYEACAAALDRRWGAKGRSVSASLLRSSLLDIERNNFRAEWLDWFASRSKEVAELLAKRVKPIKTTEEQLADLEAEVREELSHRRAEQVIRRAKSR